MIIWIGESRSMDDLFANNEEQEDVLFGNLEYEHRFSNKSYHRDRNFKNISGKMEALDYDGIFNAEVGVKFKLSRFDVTTSYELRDIHNHLFKVGFGVKF